MESYRVEKQAVQCVQLPDQDVEIDPVPTDGAGGRRDVELDRLSSILQTFNDLFGNIDWTDNDRVRRRITEEIPRKVAQDRAYRNAMQNSDKQNARVEGENAVKRVMNDMMADETALFAKLQDDPGFRASLIDFVFRMTCSDEARK